MPSTTTPDTPVTPKGVPAHWHYTRADVKVGGTIKAVVQAQGCWAELKEVYDTLTTGRLGGPSDIIPSPKSADGNQPAGDPPASFMTSGATLSRTVAGRGSLRAEFTASQHVAYWLLDYATVSKPIRTWGADFADSADGAVNRPNLAKLAVWESYGRNEATRDRYDKYECSDTGESLVGNTLKLAQMIVAGIEYYEIFRPICTITRSYPGYVNEEPTDQPPGTIGPPAVSDLWTSAGAGPNGALDPSVSIPVKAKKWLKVMDRHLPNPDGTYTRTEQWTGADAINADLYPEHQSPNSSGKGV